jgi:hypothetical protein
LLDDQAVLACLAYVDLNPVRTGIADTPETSDYTPIRRRIRATLAVFGLAVNDASVQEESVFPPIQPPAFYPFVGGMSEAMPVGLPFHLIGYLELVSWTGQTVREDKRGALSQALPPILYRVGVAPNARLQLATEFESQSCLWIGQADRVEQVLSDEAPIGPVHILVS